MRRSNVCVAKHKILSPNMSSARISWVRSLQKSQLQAVALEGAASCAHLSLLHRAREAVYEESVIVALHHRILRCCSWQASVMLQTDSIVTGDQRLDTVPAAGWLVFGVPLLMSSDAQHCNTAVSLKNDVVSEW